MYTDRILNLFYLLSIEDYIWMYFAESVRPLGCFRKDLWKAQSPCPLSSTHKIVPLQDALISIYVSGSPLDKRGFRFAKRACCVQKVFRLETGILMTKERTKERINLWLLLTRHRGRMFHTGIASSMQLNPTFSSRLFFLKGCWLVVSNSDQLKTYQKGGFWHRCAWFQSWNLSSPAALSALDIQSFLIKPCNMSLGYTFTGPAK